MVTGPWEMGESHGLHEGEKGMTVAARSTGKAAKQTEWSEKGAGTHSPGQVTSPFTALASSSVCGEHVSGCLPGLVRGLNEVIYKERLGWWTPHHKQSVCRGADYYHHHDQVTAAQATTCVQDC